MRYVFVSIVLLTVTYGQLIIKFGVNKLGPVSFDSTTSVLRYAFYALTNLYILSGFVAAFIAGMTWLIAMSKYDLSALYPLLSLNFVLVPLGAIVLLNEPISVSKCIGTALILAGVFVLSQGQTASI